MKHALRILSLFLLFTLSGCNKDDDGGGDVLPPATQTGANTFGCYINGKPFIHNDGPLQCNYQYVDGEYYFVIQGKFEDKNPTSVTIGTLALEVNENESYILETWETGNAFGSIFLKIPNQFGQSVDTSQLSSGELKITKLDQFNLIISGTFWFDVVHPVTGETIQIRDGRFDAKYYP